MGREAVPVCRYSLVFVFAALVLFSPFTESGSEASFDFPLLHHPATFGGILLVTTTSAGSLGSQVQNKAQARSVFPFPSNPINLCHFCPNESLEVETKKFYSQRSYTYVLYQSAKELKWINFRSLVSWCFFDSPYNLPLGGLLWGFGVSEISGKFIYIASSSLTFQLTEGAHVLPERHPKIMVRQPQRRPSSPAYRSWRKLQPPVHREALYLVKPPTCRWQLQFMATRWRSELRWAAEGDSRSDKVQAVQPATLTATARRVDKDQSCSSLSFRVLFMSLDLMYHKVYDVILFLFKILDVNFGCIFRPYLVLI